MSKRKTKFLMAIAFGLIAILSVGLIFTMVNVDKGIKTREISWTEYSIGAFDESGKMIESKASIITEDFIKVDGLVFDLKDDAKIEYKVFCYNEDQEFLFVVDGVDGDVQLPEGAAYIRIQITPLEDDNGEVSIFEKSGYAKQLTVTVNK